MDDLPCALTALDNIVFARDAREILARVSFLLLGVLGVATRSH
jgi:hypothetical protein